MAEQRISSSLTFTTLCMEITYYNEHLIWVNGLCELLVCDAGNARERD